MAAKKKKKITLNEFKFWLSGVEELQDENWCPNKSQWDLIRSKIHLITEPIVKKPITNAPPINQPIPRGIPHGGSGLPLQGQPPPGQQLPSQPPPVPIAETAKKDIDSSNGQYGSNFV